ncbi:MULTISPECIES: alpha/beta fold hydrolase [Methylomonas]|uniref:AB hydrolase-1 domain-containing protein n=1 Tax=Methylomonas koyamae TaxID=702114 RepID=A0A177NWS6_9GAMM|nr:alpha/beta fold hydrolase [Methylomonas koyamae]OAI21530.1 hypothetical protein A1355_23265 [Methylomonas koyamae]
MLNLGTSKSAQQYNKYPKYPIMKVILVHGIFDTGRIFHRLIAKLEANGHQCFAPDLKPADARLGIADLSEKLKQYIDEQVSNDEPIAVVGFSMGTIVSRYYLQQLDGYRRTKAFFAISGPLKGTLTAYLYPGQGVKDLRPNSPLLNELAKSENKLAHIALHTYRTPLDAMIVPSKSSEWRMASNHKINAPLHRLMVSNQRVYTHIAKQLTHVLSSSDAGVSER